jgi:hypothetical protein
MQRHMMVIIYHNIRRHLLEDSIESRKKHMNCLRQELGYLSKDSDSGWMTRVRFPAGTKTFLFTVEIDSGTH